ncbi:hypothetical protein [Tenacibaculum jejuense]|nr:hypothetical protein [Tenacibaculum jejuense]
MTSSILKLGKQLNLNQLKQITGGNKGKGNDNDNDDFTGHSGFNDIDKSFHYSCEDGHHHEFHSGLWYCVSDEQ